MNAPVTPPIGATPVVDIDKFAGKYVELRDKIEEVKKKHKEELSPYVETLEQLNGVILKHLQTQNAQNQKTASGHSVFVSEKKSASIADMSAFWTHVVTSGDFDMVDKKANVTAVFDFIEKHKTNPPGVNVSITHIAGVRRATGK